MLTRNVMIGDDCGEWDGDISCESTLHWQIFVGTRFCCWSCKRKVSINFCGVCFVNDSKATVKKWKISRKQSCPPLVLIFVNPFPKLIFYSPWKQFDLFREHRKGGLKWVSFSVNKRSCPKALGKISRKEHQNAIETIRGDLLVCMSNFHDIEGWVSRFWTHVEIEGHFSVNFLWKSWIYVPLSERSN